MDIKQTVTVLTLVFLFSCGSGNESKEKGSATADSNQQPKKIELNGCYQMHIVKDTAKLKLNTEGDSVIGTLSYKRYEKDSNDGIVRGTIKGETIKLWYRFGSEGVVSVREVYFKIIGDKLIEGYGDMEMRGDTAYFSYPTALRYEEQHPYIKVSCN